MKPKDQFVVVEEGHGGVTGYEIPGKGYGQGHTSGYGALTDSHWTERMAEGCVVIDKTMVPFPDLVRAAVDSPLLDTRLTERQVLPPVSDMMLAGLGGSFKAMALRHNEDKAWGGLDSVGIDEYVAFWRSVGARIGTVRGGIITWGE